MSPLNALILGGIAAVPSYFAIQFRARTSFDDSLDVVAAHGVGGTVGALLTGVFAEKSINTVADGLLYGNPGQLLIQGTAVLAAIVYSGVASFILLKLIGLVIPLTATTAEQVEGLDISAHGEEAYMQRAVRRCSNRPSVVRGAAVAQAGTQRGLSAGVNRLSR